MLERATGSLENAGRLILQDSNGVIRNRSCLSGHFWKHNDAGADAPQWFVALLQASGQRSSSILSTQRKTRESSDGIGPSLEFLCPRLAQTLVASRLPRSQNRTGFRRRPNLGFPRSYVSISSLPQTTSKPSPSHNNASKGQGPRSSESPDKAGKASASLRAFLEKDGTEFDKAWVLYVAAGFPSNLRPVLCAYLSKSVQPKQRERAWKLFNEISPEDRTKSDFENIISSQLLSPEKPFHLDLICQQAISTPFAQDIISRCLLHMAKHRQWSKITSLWGSLLETPENERLPLDSLLDRFDRIHLPEYSFSRHIFALLAYLQKDTGKLSAAKEDFSRRLIKRFVASRDMIKITPIPTLLSLLRRSRPLGLFTNRHYFDLMEVFLNSKHRSEFVKCILVYRQMRLESPDATPFLYTIRAILDRLLEFNMTESMIYFLDEEAHFDEYNRPSLRSYHGVMDAFSKIGDVRTVQDLFDRLLADHGIPKSQRSVAPLLAVHARLGDVAETRRQFERIPTEFGLPLSPVCWNILLLAYTTAKDLSGAVSTFSDMRENYVPPNSYTFGTLMGIFAERGDVDAIRQLLKEAQKSRVQISRPMLDTAVTVYCKNGQLGHAEALVASSWNLAVGGSPLRMWNFLLMRYAFRVSKFSFRRVLDRMGRLGLKPDQMTYAAIMAAYVYAKQVDRAQDTLRKMHEAGLQATEHHYSILLLGYVKQRNRDMVHVLSREIQARFGRVGMEASLLNLRMQTARDIENAKDLQTPVEDIVLENAEKTLSESIAQFNANPAPVDGRRSEGSAIESFTETHYQRLVDAYGTQGGAEKALQIFTHYMQLRRAAGSSDGDALGSLPIDFIRAVMNAYSETKNYEKVEECWNSIMGRASEEARTYDLDKTLFARSSTLPQPAPTESPLPSILSMSTTEAEKPKIIPAQRFILDNPLSIYLESLARRGMSERIHQVVAEVQAAGFALTGFNWSTYVRVLATSDIYSDNVEAFRLFEEKFIAHFPGWSWFLKGYGVRPINAPVTILHLEGRAGITKPRRMMGRMARRHWRKIEPDYMHPHYPTMVHLASTLQRLRQTSIAQGKENLANIYKIAPKTVDVLAAMPYSRDKHQGVILRGKAPRNHPLPRPAHLFSSRSGALGPSSDMRERSFDNAIKEPLKLNKDEYSEPSVSEWNTSGLLPSGQQKVLGPLASILPREDRIDLETTVLEHFEETISWEERSERYNRIIAMAYKTKDIALADVYKRRLAKMQRANTRRLTRERQLFDKHNRKWKLDASNHLLFKTDTGLHVRPGRKPSQRDAVRNRHKGPWTPSDESGDDR